MWDTALKFLCPGLFITSLDHLESIAALAGSHMNGAILIKGTIEKDNRNNASSPKTTRRSKILSRALARRAITSADHLQCAVVLKVACVICTVLRNITKLK